MSKSIRRQNRSLLCDWFILLDQGQINCTHALPQANPPAAANSQALSLTQRQQALAPRMPVTTSAAPNASIVPKSGVIAPNTAVLSKL